MVAGLAAPMTQSTSAQLTRHVLQEDVQAVVGCVKLVANVPHYVGVAEMLVTLQLL